nr:PREDICTED: uncharacterized protein LOC104640225 [Balearica regulorum gibbericeps]
MGVISIVPHMAAQHPGEGKNQAENVGFFSSNVQALAAEKPPWDVGRQPSGKILSLDRQGAKKVLEIYVSRSLSCCENSLMAKKTLQKRAGRRGRKADGLQRSKSDFCEYLCGKPGPKKDQEEGPKVPDLDEALDDESKAPGEVPKEEPEPKRKSTKNSSQGKTQRTWFKSFLNFLIKKSPEEALKKRPSLKKVFSFKKHAEEEWGEAAAGVRTKRPGCLPLRHIQAPATPDEAIRRIVALLQSAGDELDRQVKEDARLRMFFKDMSYSSFKNLADAYVHKEMTASRPDINPQEIQFAFTVHLTAKVAGICNQAVNRIMGFGTRYLEDSFAPLSYSKILQGTVLGL